MHIPSKLLQVKVPNGLDVILIPKNAESLPGYSTCRNVHNTRNQLAGDLVPEHNQALNTSITHITGPFGHISHICDGFFFRYPS